MTTTDQLNREAARTPLRIPGGLIAEFADPSDALAYARALGPEYTVTSGINEIFGVRKLGLAKIIDLRQRYRINVEADPIRGEYFTAIDEITYDADPFSELHIEGFGRSPQEATCDLLEQLAAIAVRS